MKFADVTRARAVPSRGMRATPIGLLLVAVVGCVADPGEPVDESEVVQAATTAFANDKPAFDFFVGKGLTDFQAAGIVGNLDQESGVDPKSVQYGGGPGRGIAQWSVGGRWDTSANDNVLDFASMHGTSATSLSLQLQFIWYEMTEIGYGYNALKATTTVNDAVIAFMAKYEICGTCESAKRVSYAKSVLAAYGGSTGSGSGSGDPPPGSDPDPSGDIDGGCTATTSGSASSLLFVLAAIAACQRRRRRSVSDAS
jgi:hypothetical protein